MSEPVVRPAPLASLDLWLELPGRDDPETLAPKARALRFLALANVVANELLIGELGSAAVLGACLIAGGFPRIARLAYIVAACWWTGVWLQAFPSFANHGFLQLFLLWGIACLRFGDEREDVLLLQFARWLTVLVFFWAGAKKVLFGHYFGGEFLSYLIASTDRFAEFFSWWLPSEEIARLRNLPREPGSGPFRVDSAIFVAFSNAVYVSEMGAALLLLWERARRFAWLVGLAILIGIELAAREMMFGMLCVSLFLCFPADDRLRRFVPWAVALYVLGLAMAYQLIPGWTLN